MGKGRRLGCFGVVVSVGFLLAATSQIGCSSSADEDTGVVRVAITAVPGDVLCIQITAQGTRTTVQEFQVTPGDSPMLRMSGLALGDNRFTAAAFPSRCAVGNFSPSPTWVSDPILATIVQNVVAQIDLVMHRNGRASISIDFPDDPTCVPEGGPCGSCCPGTTCDGSTGLCAACISVGDACDPTQLCCDGQACATGICGESPACVADGQPCDGTQPCCSSAVECIGGTCGGCADGGMGCGDGQPCCSGVDCTDGVCGGCFFTGTACDGSKPCCGGDECSNGACGGCLFDGSACDGTQMCCSGAPCGSGTCGGPECITEGAACGGLANCCPGLGCVGGTCLPCLADGTFCALIGSPPCCLGGCNVAPFTCGGCVAEGAACDRPNCCAGHPCVNGTCNGPTCSPDGVACDDVHPCCSGAACTSGICEAPLCTADGAACDGTKPCCSDVACTSGICGGPCLADGASCDGPGFCCSTGTGCFSGACDNVAPWVVFSCEDLGVAFQFTMVSSDGTMFFRSTVPWSAGQQAPSAGGTGRISPEALTKLLSAARTLDSSHAGYTTTITRNSHSITHAIRLTSAGAPNRSTLVDSIQDGAGIGRRSATTNNDSAANEIRQYCRFQ